MYTQQTTTNRRAEPTNNGQNTASGPTRTPVRVFREGAIAASIWEREGANGTFYDFTLSRSWKNETSGKSGYSTNFTARNAAALQKVIGEATRFIEERQPKSDSSSSAENNADIPF